MELQHDPIAVIQAINRAADGGDVTGMVAFFSDKAVIKLDPPLPPPFQSEYRGRAEIRSYVDRLLSEGFHIESSDMKVEGDKVTWRSRVTSGFFGEEGAPPPTLETSSEAVVRGGLIEWLKIHYSPQSLQIISQALSKARQPQ